MRVVCMTILLLALLALCVPAFGIDPSGKDGVTRPDASADLNPRVTLDHIEALQKRAEAAKRLGMADEAARLEAIIDRLAQVAVPAPEREEVIPELHGGVAESKRSIGSMITLSPWAQDQLIYQGNYSYDAWATPERGKPYDVDYDSLGNIYAAVALADSTIKLFNSTDNGQTWTDRRTLAPFPAAYIPQVRILVSDDGDSAFAYIFYLWTGGGGGNLWCNVTDISTWTHAREALLETAAADSVVDFAVTRDHYFDEDYYLYVDYQDGEGDAGILFTFSDDHGGSWSTPTGLQGNSGDSELAYGGYSSGGNLYRVYTYLPSHPDSSRIHARMSDDYGATWNGSIAVRDGDAGDNFNAQIEAANTPRAAQRVFTTYTTDYYNTGNWQLWSSRSDDGGLNWATIAGPSSNMDANEYASSMAVLRVDSTEGFHLAYIFDDTATTTLDSIRVQYTTTDAWDPPSSVGINDSAYAANNGPIATYSTGLPGVAYGGAAGVNVYYDNIWYSPGVDESSVRTGALRFGLGQNRPNPFSDRTAIHYTLPVKTDVSVKIYDVSGRLVRTLVSETRNAGVHVATWDGKSESGSLVSNGVYFYRLSSGSGVETRKLNLIR